MAVLLPIAWATIALALLGRDFSTREAILGSYALTCAYLVTVTYALSTQNALQAEWVALSWLLLIALLGITLRRSVARGMSRAKAVVLSPRDRGFVVTTGLVGLFALLALAAALLYPTTNYDSLTYHMPRVFFWYQNHSVAHFATPEPRQLFSAPLVEYIALHLKVLSGGSDRLVNLAQFTSYLLAVMTASMLAGKLGAQRQGQRIAAVVAAISPMALLQASTTQTDLTAALWCLSAIYAMLAYLVACGETRRDRVLVWAAWAGLSIALAAAAKPTSYLVCAPFVVWLLIALLRRERPARTVAAIAVATACFLTVSAPWFAQNARALDGDVVGLGAPGNAHTIVKDRHPGALAVNAVKNTAMQLGVPSVAGDVVIARGVASVITGFGGDIQNPGTQEDAEETFTIGARVSNHDVAPAPLSMALLLVTCAALAASWPRIEWSGKLYALSAVVSWLLVTSLVTWNQFVTRIELGAMLVLLPLVGVALDATRRAGLGRVLYAAAYSFIALAVAWALIVSLFSTTNRLVSADALGVRVGARDLGWWERSYTDLAFDGPLPQWKSAFEGVAAAAHDANARSIGLDVRVGNFALYPLLPLLADREVRYTGENLLPYAPEPGGQRPDITVRIWPATESAAGDISARAIVFGPVAVDDAVLVVYRTDATN